MIDEDILRFGDDGVYFVSCWNCGGFGEHSDECRCQDFEDTCMCLVPEPPVCRECKGSGELRVEPSKTEVNRNNGR